MNRTEVLKAEPPLSPAEQIVAYVHTVDEGFARCHLCGVELDWLNFGLIGSLAPVGVGKTVTVGGICQKCRDKPNRTEPEQVARSRSILPRVT